jgi:hypothetical protein
MKKMAKQICISIPAELHARAQKLRGQLKVSKVCQQALNNAATQIELNNASPDSLDLTVQRLKDEMMKENKKIVLREAIMQSLNVATHLSHEDYKGYHTDPEYFGDVGGEELYEKYGDPSFKAEFDMHLSYQLRLYFYDKYGYHFYNGVKCISSNVFDNNSFSDDSTG